MRQKNIERYSKEYEEQKGTGDDMIKRLWTYSQTADGDGIIAAAIVVFGLLVTVGLVAVIR